MELIPIIKLSLVVFALVAGFVITLSYMMYKLRKNDKKPWLRKTLQSITRVTEQHARMVQMASPAPAFASMTTYTEQVNQASFRHARAAEPKVQRIERPRERYQVVNNQQVELRKVNYYHSQVREFVPSTEQKVNNRSFNRNNVLSNYSSGNDSLKKMSFN